MAGAISLAGMSALRSGAGLLTLAVPDVCIDVVAGFEPSYMTLGLPSDPDGRLSLESLTLLYDYCAEMDVAACGPGLGRSNQLTHMVGQLYERIDKPLVLDADALNALSELQTSETSFDSREHAGPRVMTPHPGEFYRLCDTARIQFAGLQEAAIEYALTNDVVVVLKGHRTVVTDGNSTAINTTGNPGMATGGSGDVLTGIITALIGQGMLPFDAARYGCFVHGVAGDMAAAELGEVSMIASDIVRFLPQAFQVEPG